MAELSQSSPVDAGVELKDRRVWVRFSCEVSGSCQPAIAGGPERWPARILNVSSGGLLLASRRRFEPKTLLHIEVETPAGNGPCILLARVIHVGTAADPDAGWRLGCTFGRQLGHKEIQSIVDDPAI